MKKQVKQKQDSGLKNLAIFVIIIVILGIGFGVFIKQRTTPKIEKEYSNGFVFIKLGNTWVTSIKNSKTGQEFNVEFRYPPSSVKNIATEGNLNDFFRLLNINELNAAYFTFNPRENLTYMNVVAADLAKFMKLINEVTLVAACTENSTDACSDRNIVTCENQNGESMVLFVKNSQEPKLSMKENCLIIEGNGEELLKAYTKLLFVWYGIL